MDFNSDNAVQIPESNVRPFSGYLEYKSGKTPASFAQAALPEQVGAGFSYYDKESNTRIRLDKFRAIVIGHAFGIAGVTKLGDKYTNYRSNLVADTRTDPMRVFMAGVNHPQHEGLYKNIKPLLPQGVGFQHYLAVYIPELNDVKLLSLTMALSEHLRESIAAAATASSGRKVATSRVNMFALMDMANQYYMFTFDGQFVKKTKDNTPWSGNTEMYFLPATKVGSITDAKQVAFLNEHSERFGNWLFTDIAKNIDAINASGNTSGNQHQSVPAVPAGASLQNPPAPAQSNAKQVMMQAGWTEDDGSQFPTNDTGSGFGNDLPF